MQEEAQHADREADEPHHEPPVPVQPGRLLLQPVAVHLGVGRHVVQRLVRVQDLPLLLGVLRRGRKLTIQTEIAQRSPPFYNSLYLPFRWFYRPSSGKLTT